MALQGAHAVLGLTEQQLEQYLHQFVDEPTIAQINLINQQPDISSREKDERVMNLIMERIAAMQQAPAPAPG
jgi:hypothetical protein